MVVAHTASSHRPSHRARSHRGHTVFFTPPLHTAPSHRPCTPSSSHRLFTPPLHTAPSYQTASFHHGCRDHIAVVAVTPPLHTVVTSPLHTAPSHHGHTAVTPPPHCPFTPMDLYLELIFFCSKHYLYVAGFKSEDAAPHCRPAASWRSSSLPDSPSSQTCSVAADTCPEHPCPVQATAHAGAAEHQPEDRDQKGPRCDSPCPAMPRRSLVRLVVACRPAGLEHNICRCK